MQGDSEFAQGDIKAWRQAHNIRVINTLACTPQCYGKIERINQERRKKTKAGFIRNNNFAHLQDYIDNINNQVESSSKQTPNSVWTSGYRPHAYPHIAPQGVVLNDATDLQQRQDCQEQHINQLKMIAHGRQPQEFDNTRNTVQYCIIISRVLIPLCLRYQLELINA
jgi:hypothetical protein